MVTHRNTDQTFNGIAGKFERNIYGTGKGKVRQAVLEHVLFSKIGKCPPMQILDLGGGTGAMAHSLLEWGHAVDIVDASQDVLDVASKSLSKFDNVTFRCARLQDFNADKKYDLVVCHAVLEWLSDPLNQLLHIVKHVADDGFLSLSFFNRDAALFGNMLYGNFDYVKKGLKGAKQVRLNPQNSFHLHDVLCALETLNVNIQQVTGVRCFHDYMKGPPRDDNHFLDLIELEKRYCQQDPFRLLGKYLHVFANIKQC